ncbi:hypothetical protein BDZ89DRAFT_1063730 [Hymenopellis radicata]|nr:hypothetical protein BDZ89DRAFT_1063730 [Hymenopellis radicata]
MSSGLDLFRKAEVLYYQDKVDDTFDYYQRAIRKILKDEIVTAAIPAEIARDPKIANDKLYPRELLGLVWRNFVGYFKDHNMKKSKDTSREAYKLLLMFSPKSTHDFHRFRTDKAKILLKGMQISAALTLGLLAWDSKDRVAAVKYYRAGLDMAKEYPGYDKESEAAVGWESFIADEVSEMRDNMAILLRNDEWNVQLSAALFGGTGNHKRKEVVEGIGYQRTEADGTVNFERGVQIASDKCGNCGKRDAKMKKCSVCKGATYCDKACQTADWPNHKAACRASRT